MLQLNPGEAGEAETISGRSTTFLRRRKAKRQAEVVASMALMSALNGGETSVGGSLDWENLSTPSVAAAGSGGENSFRNFKGKRIVTKPMDDPSVLSESAKNDNAEAKDALASCDNNTLANRLAQIEARRQRLAAMNQQQRDFDSHKGSSPAKSPRRRINSIDDQSYGSEDASEDESYFTYVTEYGESYADDSKNSIDKDDFLKNAVDPVVNGLTSVFNAFTCVPMNGFVAEMSGPPPPPPPPPKKSWKELTKKKETPRKSTSTPATSRPKTPTATPASPPRKVEETLSDIRSERDEELSRFVRSLDGSEVNKDEQRQELVDSRKSRASSNRRDEAEAITPILKKPDQPAPQVMLQHSESTDSESDILRELNLSSSDEEEEEVIEVRSSIRETMNDIVSKAQDSQDEVDRNWLSYELRNDAGPENVLSSTNTRRSRASSIDEKPKKRWLRPKSPFHRRRNRAEI